ncbi:MAG: flagellar basal body rod protein FlgB [Gammaproteobacteria bacterium]|nr:MAG: flagellar basal body rod protein FlgB [Gammaproteobacteria bacterium]
MAMSFNSILGLNENALLLRAKRAEILASNIANANTPGFKARDFDFHKALKVATSQQTSGLSRTHQSHFSGVDSNLPVRLQYINPFQAGTGDGNSVDLPSQQVAFAENAMEYQMSLRFLNGKIKGLLSAIKGE